MISYEGIDEAVLIHALYQHAYKPGLGSIMTPAAMLDVMGSIKGLSVEDVRAEFCTRGPVIGIDYYRGRPLKVSIDIETKEFDSRLFDRDAVAGVAQRVVDYLRAQLRATP